jgi:hypothetical protein
MRASSGCLTADGYLVRGPTLVAKNATRMGHPRETSFVENYRDQMIRNIVPSGAKVWEKSVVPPGLESFVPLFPALARWAKLVRPSGAGFSRFITIFPANEFTHTFVPLRRLTGCRPKSGREPFGFAQGRLWGAGPRRPERGSGSFS